MTVITTEVRETRPKNVTEVREIEKKRTDVQTLRENREKRTDVQTLRENLNTSKLFKPEFPVEFQRLSGWLKSGPT